MGGYPEKYWYSTRFNFLVCFLVKDMDHVQDLRRSYATTSFLSRFSTLTGSIVKVVFIVFASSSS